MKTVSAADANRHFSRILREVDAGQTVVVTSRGRPVAEIRPIAPTEDTNRKAAWEAHFARLDAQPALNLGRFNRDEVYDD